MRLDYKVVCLCLSEVTLQELAAVAVPETAYGLLLDLADPLAGEAELLAYLLEGHFLSTDTEEVLDDIPLPLGEGGQGALDLLVQGLIDQTAVGVGRVIVDQHVQQAVVLSVHERSVYGNVTAGYAEGVGDLVAGNVENLRQFVGRGHALVVLFELLESLVDLVKGTHLVQRQTDDPGLLGQSLEYRLAYPPHGVGYELEAAGLVELLGGLDKTQVALVDQVGKAQSLILVLFRNRNDEAEIGLRQRQLLEGRLVPFAYSLCQFHFLIHPDKLLPADLLKILVQGGALAVGNRFCNLKLSHYLYYKPIP